MCIIASDTVRNMVDNYLKLFYMLEQTAHRFVIAHK